MFVRLFENLCFIYVLLMLVNKKKIKVKYFFSIFFDWNWMYCYLYVLICEFFVNVKVYKFYLWLINIWLVFINWVYLGMLLLII